MFHWILKDSYLKFLRLASLLFILPDVSTASTLTLWDRSQIQGVDSYPSYIAACNAYHSSTLSYQARQYKQVSSNQWQCFIYDPLGLRYPPYLEHLGYVTSRTLKCPLGHTGALCNASTPVCAYGIFNPDSNQCVAASDKGQPPQACSASGSAGGSHELINFAGDPINFLTGNKFHQEVYYQSTHSRGIVFKRTYNSADAVWRHSYSDRLIFNSDHIQLIMADGRELRYSPAGVALDSAAERFGVLEPSGGGWRFTTKNQTGYEFDAQGRLTRVTLSNGQPHQLTYVTSDSSTQVFLTDGFGNQINFKENSTGSLYALNATDMTMSFAHNSDGQLIKTTRTINGQQLIRQYHYEDPRNTLLLTGITDERGVRYATWTYDAQGRAISSQHTGGADKVLISYNTDGSTTVTNELSKKTTYRFAVIDGSKRIIAIEGQPSANCPNSNSTFTYDSRGLLTSKTDNKGQLTTYTYNTRGLEVSRTEASGTPQARTITTDWHPTLFLPTVVTEPNQITRYHYDDQGRQLSRTVEER